MPPRSPVFRIMQHGHCFAFDPWCHNGCSVAGKQAADTPSLPLPSLSRTRRQRARIGRRSLLVTSCNCTPTRWRDRWKDPGRTFTRSDFSETKRGNFRLSCELSSWPIVPSELVVRGASPTGWLSPRFADRSRRMPQLTGPRLWQLQQSVFPDTRENCDDHPSLQRTPLLQDLMFTNYTDRTHFRRNRHWPRARRSVYPHSPLPVRLGTSWIAFGQFTQGRSQLKE